MSMQGETEDKEEKSTHEKVRENNGSVARLLGAIPIRVVFAMALAWVFDPMLSYRPLVPPDGILRFDNISLGLPCLACALFPNRAGRFLEARCSAPVACIAGLAGAVISVILALDSTGDASLSLVALSAIALFCITLFQGYVLILAFCRIAYLGMMKSLVAFTIWLASAGFLMLLLPLAQSLFSSYAQGYFASSLISSAIPVLVFRLIHKKKQERSERVNRSATNKNIPYNLLIVQFVILVVIKGLGVLITTSVASDFKSMTSCGFLIAGVGILVFLRLRRKLIDLKWLYNVALFLVELSILLLSLSMTEASYASGMLMGCAYTVFAVFCFTIYSNMCLRYRIDPIRLSALAFSCENIASALGVLLSPMLLQNGAMRTTALVALSMTIAVVFLFLFSDTGYRTGWNSERGKNSTEKIIEHYYSMPSVCSALARQYDLSTREEDILLLLLQKKSGPVIAKELYISPSTVKSHTRNIYRKLDVHSREELLALVEAPSRGRG